MVKVTIEFDGGTEVFTGDAVSCVVITNKPDEVEVMEALKGTLNTLRFPQILADTCFSQVKASQKNHSPLDQLEALEAFTKKNTGADGPGDRGEWRRIRGTEADPGSR